jgi:pimeloyl-ACP methyl ester carboxylesterase
MDVSVVKHHVGLMFRKRFSWLPVVTVALALAGIAAAQAQRPEMIVVRNGSVSLKAQLWKAPGPAPHPAILLNHGSGRSAEELKRLGSYEQNAGILGPVFTRHGYVVLYPFRRGVGPSADQGASAVDLMGGEATAGNPAARNAVQMKLLEGREMGDALAALTLLRTLPGVDSRRIALVGHSFGGSLTLLIAQREPSVKAVVVFSAAGYSWDRSPELREHLLEAVGHIDAPVMFIHAANDFSTASGEALSARMTELRKPNLLKLYPPFGDTAEQGHDLIHLGVWTWESDVFRFLDKTTGSDR